MLAQKAQAAVIRKVQVLLYFIKSGTPREGDFQINRTQAEAHGISQSQGGEGPEDEPVAQMLKGQ